MPHWKGTAGCAPERIDTPASVTIPMSMHIGAPAEPVVAPGDAVRVGQLIGRAGGFVSSPIYASVSGTVKRIDDFHLSSGQLGKAVVIESDGKQELFEGIAPPQVEDTKSFLAAVRDSGVVGLGGAGFPTAVKFSLKDPSKLEAVIVNGSECEPCVTSDTRTMLDNTDLVWDGIGLLQKYLGAKRVIIAIEANKPQCIAKFRPLVRNGSGVELAVLKSMYPQGGEKVLIYHTTGRVVPEGGLPIDAGAVVVNCTTLAAVARYIKTGMPLVEKCVTVDGSAVAKPKNVIAPIGTPISALFDFCGGFRSEPGKVLYGGPMMGLAVPDLDVPVLKNTNAVVAFTKAESLTPEPSACIRCGRCVDNCPLSLMPTDIELAYELKKPGDLEKLKVNLCMECGCCAFVCPAHRPLVQVNKLAKAMLKNYQAEKKAALEKKEKEKEAAK